MSQPGDIGHSPQSCACRSMQTIAARVIFVARHVRLSKRIAHALSGRREPRQGTYVAGASQQHKPEWERVSARQSVAHYIQDLHLVSVLDELRDAYDLCKDQGRPDLQSLLMQIRRKLIEALHQSLDLYSENAELRQQLSQAQAEIGQLRASRAHPELTVEAAPARSLRKLS